VRLAKNTDFTGAWDVEDASLLVHHNLGAREHYRDMFCAKCVAKRDIQYHGK